MSISATSAEAPSPRAAAPTRLREFSISVNSAGASGTYNLSGGSLSGGLEFIGFLGSGSFTQSGSTNSSASNLNIGNSMGGSGTYNLSGGSLTVVSNENIGSGGSGAFTQTGGTNAVTGNLSVGAGAGPGPHLRPAGGHRHGGRQLYPGGPTTARPGISSPVNFEKLLVTGTASLNGTVAPVLLGGYLPVNGQLFHGVITTTGGVSGVFSSVANSTPIVSWQALYTPTTFDLLAGRNYAAPRLT